MVFACVNQVVFSTETSWMSGGQGTGLLHHCATSLLNRCSLASGSVGKLEFFCQLPEAVACAALWHLLDALLRN